MDAALGLWWREARATKECCAAALRHVDQCAASGLIPDTVALGLTASAWASTLLPYSENPGASYRPGSELVIAGQALPTPLGNGAVLRGRQWLSQVYAAHAYQVEHGQLPKEGRENAWALLVDQPAAPHPHAVLAEQHLSTHDSALATASQRAAAASAVPYRARLQDSDDSSFNLSKWMGKTRWEARRGNLSVGRATILDTLLGVNWQVAQGTAEWQHAWEHGLACAQAFRQGHGRQPMQHEILVDDGSEYRVGKWRHNQKCRATPEQRLQLDMQLPGWDGPC